jgi:hypothetical protein
LLNGEQTGRDHPKDINSVTRSTQASEEDSSRDRAVTINNDIQESLPSNEFMCHKPKEVTFIFITKVKYIDSTDGCNNNTR